LIREEILSEMQNLHVTSIVSGFSRRFQNKRTIYISSSTSGITNDFNVGSGIGRLLLSVTIPEIEFCAKVKLQKTMSKKVNTLIGYNLVYVAKLQIF
jgi:hypothetical protein